MSVCLFVLVNGRRGDGVSARASRSKLVVIKTTHKYSKYIKTWQTSQRTFAS